MATAGGPNIVTEGLEFGFDTGYPRVAENSDTYKFYLGEPTENLVGNPTFIGTPGTQTQGVTPANWIFSGEPGPNGFLFYDSGSSPIPLKFPNEGSVITINSGSQNRRIYFRRTDLLPNTTYTISCWMYFSGSFTNSWSKFQYDSTGSSLGIGYFDSFSNYASANGHSLEEWFLWEGTLTTEPTTTQCYWGPVISSAPKNLVGLQRMKVEVKDHRTPFVNGTRSISGSLIDLTRTNDIDLSNVSFDSNAQMTFDGTDDFLTLPDLDTYSSTAKFTVEGVVQAISGNWSRIFTNGSTGGQNGITGFINVDLLVQTSSSKPYIYLRVGNSLIVQTQISTNNWSVDDFTMYFAFSADKGAGTGSYLFRFGQNTGLIQRELSGTYTPGTATGFVENRLGAETTNESYAQMKMYTFKMYNKQLSVPEMRTNYNALKNRFKI